MARANAWTHAIFMLTCLLVLAGCASTNRYTFEREEGEYIEANILPLRKSGQNQKALTLLQARFNEKCGTSTTLGVKSFSGNFRNTDREPVALACVLLNAQIAQLLHETGDYQRAVPALLQAMHDHLLREGGWRYNSVACSDLSTYDHLLSVDKVAAVPLHQALYESLDRAGRPEAKLFLYKTYLCRLDNRFSKQEEAEAVRAEFMAQARKHLDQAGAAEVQKYIRVIEIPLSASERRIQERAYLQKSITHLQASAQLTMLYTNALDAMQRNNLNSQTSTGAKPFIEHWTVRLEDARKNLKYAAKPS